MVHVDENLKVAFIGDQGLGSNAQAVLQLIQDEGADMVLHQGDFDYQDNPTAWDAQITDILGSDFPYFASVGNHDLPQWSVPNGYQDRLEERLARIDGAVCVGDYGSESACTYRGLFFILSGIGTTVSRWGGEGEAHTEYLTNTLEAANHTWKLCTWHKNQNQFQLGEKGDEVGWGPYASCLEKGALIITAHEHSYQRTRTLIDTEFQVVDPEWSEADVLRVAEGATFVVVSGIAGHSIRNQDRCLPPTFPYGCNEEWASAYTSDQDAKFGALFCSFYTGGRANQAECYFKNVEDEVVDEFSVFSEHYIPDEPDIPSGSSGENPGSPSISSGCAFRSESGFWFFVSVILLFGVQKKTALHRKTAF